MPELSLVYPMLALVLLTCGVLIVLFRSRVRMIREGLAPVSYFRVFQGSPEPEFAAKPSRHLTNLFEAPTLFYAGCLTAMVAGVSGVGVVVLAWGYVAMRYLHTYIHLGSNRVRYRMRAFFASWLFLVALWVHIGVSVALNH